MLTTEIANKVGVTAETVRFYTRKGLLPFHKDELNGYKRYDKNALEQLKFITHARKIGFSLKEIEQIIRHSQQGNSPCPTVRQLLSDKIKETQQHIQDLQRHLTLMQETYAEWETQADMEPNGDMICCLIQNWSDKAHHTTEEGNSDE